MNWSHVSEMVQRHRLAYGVMLAVVIGLLLTAISMSLYISSGASHLDLSRPGYEKARTQVAETKGEKFDASGPINTDVIDEFQKLYNKHREALRSSDAFDSTVLDDSQLRLNEE